MLLGTLAAVEFSAHSYLQAMIVPVIFLLAPVRSGPGGAYADRGAGPRRGGGSG